MMDETQGVRGAKGDVAEVWQGGQKVGTLFDWSLEGTADSWAADALKQTFSPAFRGGEVEVRFLLTATSERLYQLRGIGEVTGYVTGIRARQSVQMRGTRLWQVTGTLLPDG